MTRYVIALSELGINNNNLISLLLEHSFEIEDMFAASRHVFDMNLDLMIYFDIFDNEAKVSEALSKADAILYRNKELGIKTTYYTDSTYPIELAKINDPPAIIYYKGAEFNDISDKAIACVGTRKPTRLSYNATNYLIPQWVKEDCSIISGLACGVDKIPSLTLTKEKNGYKPSNYAGCSHFSFGNDMCYFFSSFVFVLFMMLLMNDFEINS